jgi:hypothetical protein
MTKSVAFIMANVVLWGLAFFPHARPGLAGLTKKHVFFTSSQLTLSVVSFESKEVEHLLLKAFALPRRLQSFGFSVRGWALQIPDWLFLLPDPRRMGHINILIREEVADEFISRPLEDAYQDSFGAIRNLLGDFEAKTHHRPLLLLIPTKIFANQLHPAWTQARLQDQEVFEIESHSVQRSPGEAQAEMESRLSHSGEKLISLLNLYDQVRDEIYPLYSFGESHWSHELSEKAAAHLLAELVRTKTIDQKCYDQEALARKPAAGNETFFGDLAVVIGLDRASPLGRAVETQTKAGRFNGRPEEKLGVESAVCPDLFYLGTSYGNVHAGTGSITDVIAALYHGRIFNHSISGLGPLTAMQKFEPAVLAKPSPLPPIVIWEMPFRYIKDIGLKEGHAFYPVQRHRKN